MSESMQVLPSASSGASQSKVLSAGNADNTDSVDDPAGFDSVYANYVETEADGNPLPAEEQTAMWQALMLLQPAENVINNSTSNTLQGMGLLDAQRKPILNSVLSNQDYFNMMTTKNKELANSLPIGLSQNNMGIQLAAAHLNTETNDALLLNISEQLTSAQNLSSTLSQGLSAAGLGTAVQAATTQAQIAPLNLGQNAWEANFNSRLQMMIGKNIQTAEIRLDPPELGSLEIKIKIINDVATVNIVTAHAQVREALEASIPKLREMFEESGVTLGDVNVQQESFAQHENAENDETSISSATTESMAIDAEEQVSQKIVSNNLLDIYA